MRLTLAALLSGAVLLAGCGNSAGDSSTRSFDSAQAVADTASLDNCRAPDQRELGVTDEVDCDQGSVDWFKSTDAQNGWAKIVKSVDASGLGGGAVLYGNRWAIECATMDDCRSAQAILGGTIR